LGSGSGDQAIKDSVPPRIRTRTSPGPADPRVGIVILPTQPMAEVFATTAEPLLLRSAPLSNQRIAVWPASGRAEYTTGHRRY
jgi:hypothetical protein